MSNGEIPYKWLTNKEVALQVPTGERYLQCLEIFTNRLPKPDICTDSLWNLLQHCWEFDPAKRPHFVEIVQHLDEAIERRPDSMPTDVNQVGESNYVEDKKLYEQV